MQLPTAMPGALPGTRVVSAEQRAPDQGGLFKDTGLVQSKDTGGVGTAQLHPCIAEFCVFHFENSSRTILKSYMCRSCSEATTHRPKCDILCLVQTTVNCHLGTSQVMHAFAAM